MFKKIAVALSASFIFGTIIFTYCTPLFQDFTDEYTVYFISASSTGKEEKVSENEFPIFSVLGESFSFTNGKYSVSEIFAAFSARLIFTESVSEGVSYYAYSDEITRYKLLGDKKINLHVFVGKSQTTVGSPIIFGSF